MGGKQMQKDHNSQPQIESRPLWSLTSAEVLKALLARCTDAQICHVLRKIKLAIECKAFAETSLERANAMNEAASIVELYLGVYGEEQRANEPIYVDKRSVKIPESKIDHPKDRAGGRFLLMRRRFCEHLLASEISEHARDKIKLAIQAEGPSGETELSACLQYYERKGAISRSKSGNKVTIQILDRDLLNV